MIRMVIQPKTLDPDPDSMIPDPSDGDETVYNCTLNKYYCMQYVRYSTI
jgi:hypothetical protein